VRGLDVVLYLSTFLPFGTERGEQIYTKVALLLRLKNPVYFVCDPDTLTLRPVQPRLSRYPLCGYDTILTELCQLTLVLFDSSTVK